MIHDKQSGPQRVALEAGSVARATTDSSPSATDATTTTRARCLSCARRLTDPRSIAHGFGPVCWTRMANRQRHERAEALHARLRDVLRRLPDLDVQGLAVLSAALDDAVDALDGKGLTR